MTVLVELYSVAHAREGGYILRLAVDGYAGQLAVLVGIGPVMAILFHLVPEGRDSDKVVVSSARLNRPPAVLSVHASGLSLPAAIALPAFTVKLLAELKGYRRSGETLVLLVNLGH